ncbi:GTP-binding protein [Candidatus Microgenomates bacterium]|nr:GTP-binding protein [Candidatus Microgenomates bacterium]
MIKPRQPIVTVLGHVDHGKTTLLDAVRKSNIASREAGGITQSIGATVVEAKKDKLITFIDTPGHAAFSGMRSRGAKAADIAILVVASDDGVKPQTKEAIGLIQEAKIPFIVAFTKTDLPSANVENAKASVEREGVYLEGRGGDTPFVEVSAKQNTGVQELLDLIILVSEVNDILADTEGDLEAVVIETGKDNRGSLASVVVLNGRLTVGTEIETDDQIAKVRGLFDFQNKPVKVIEAGFPALILGFSSIPQVGSTIIKAGSEKKQELAEQRTVIKGKLAEGQLPFILKAQNAGALEALLSSIPKEIFVVTSGVGEINETDIFLAKSSNAKIYTFDLKLSNQISKLAETEKVEVKNFKIIYELLENLEALVKSGIKIVTFKAEILASFPFNSKKVAGCRLLMGQVSKGNKVILIRDDKELGEMRVTSLRRGKEELPNVTEGEFGAILDPQLDFTIGDVLISRS